MGVYIKGMEMPKSCGDCPCLSETYCCCVDGVYPYDCNILIQDTEEGAEFIGRLSNCPLIEVPPHGDLIDRDALMKKLNSCMFPSDMVTTRAVSMAMNWLKESTTVIPAEESET